MRTRIAAILVALASMAGLMLTATPAQAYGDGTSVSWENVTMFLGVDWRKQADGNGVTLEGTRNRTTSGCGALYTGGDSWRNVQVVWENPNNPSDADVYNFGDEPCNFDKSFNNAGKDKGTMLLKWSGRANRVLASDRMFYFGYEVFPDGRMEVRYAFTGPIP